jgi:hypothetical protein
MPIAMPAIDQNLLTSWNELEQDMYNSYPFYLAAFQVAHRMTYATHSRLVGKRKWIRNMGLVMRGVRKEPSPHIRQEATPQELNKVAQKDIIDVQEVTIETTLKHHKFESRILPFIPFFKDFLKDHLSATSKDLTQKIQRYEDIFVRTCIFHQAPFVFICNKGGGEVTSAPMWDGKDVSTIPTQGKNIAWRQSVIPLLGQPGTLNLANSFLVDSYLREDIRAVPWADGSSNTMPSPNSAMPGKNCLVLSNEAYNQFRFDPFVLKYKTDELDLVQKGFKGPLGDNIICKVEDLPLRMDDDGVFPGIETRELSPTAYNLNETVLSSDYKDLKSEWSFMYASDGYESLEVGPPPEEFVGRTPPKGFNDMFWNGETRLTKNFLVKGVDENGASTYEANTYGEHMKYISHLALGVLGTQRRNVVPILAKRVRGLTFVP